jgi:predicted lipoprotein with Yx(FWY)xxD motif
VTASKLSTTRRTDGTTEVTYNGWPLYTWAEDTHPGEATGQALNNNGGLWYVLDTAGDAVTVRP